MASNLIATKLIAYGFIDCEKLIDSRFSMSKAQEAFERAIIPNTYRVVIHMDE